MYTRGKNIGGHPGLLLPQAPPSGSQSQDIYQAPWNPQTSKVAIDRIPETQGYKNFPLVISAVTEIRRKVIFPTINWLFFKKLKT